MKQSKPYKGLLATIIVVALGVPAIAAADAKSDLHGASVKVSYADLNLERQEGAKALYRRLQQASKQVCDVRGVQSQRSLDGIAEARRCYRDALSEAVAEIDNDLLLQLHNS